MKAVEEFGELERCIIAGLVGGAEIRRSYRREIDEKG